MNLRESLARRPQLGVGAAVAFLLIAIVLVVHELRPNSPPADINAKAYFTTDGGKSWFADDMTNIPPYQKDGKEAVRAFVFKCADGKEFVGYLQRFTPDGKRAIEAIQTPNPNHHGPPDTSQIRMAYTTGREVKRPDDADWTNGGDLAKCAQIISVKCPNGGAADMVEP